jgi:hypothetical protein
VTLDMEGLATTNGVAHSGSWRTRLDVNARIAAACETSRVWLDIKELPTCGGQIRVFGRIERMALRVALVESSILSCCQAGKRQKDSS